MAIETKLITANSTWQEISNSAFTTITITQDQTFSTKTGGALYIGSTTPTANTQDYIQLSPQTLPIQLNQLTGSDKVYVKSTSSDNTKLRIIRG